ncbi:peptidoglycan DD-metalloendopeptidase family protein [Gilvibacter sp.]|uniref:peptidoglycan DD-metalloendopeptidase family protein n=1 Tax=Gilvibacter sp. TaxID=2729997 RepID=UPI0025C1552B|nr:peptidoglycan DD-metalloendopeptidase family protein [Gilvibacter sp.]NQX76385.1 peptidoglycan DD-metalloendopeptidase family protein [Gilvibacter sp.]
MKKLLWLSIVLGLCWACEKEKPVEEVATIVEAPKIEEAYGFILNDFNVVRDTVRNGDTFGVIMDNHHVPAAKVYSAVEAVKDSFDVRRINSGKPYVVLNSKDSLNTAQVFIYENSKIEYTVVDLRDSIAKAYHGRKPLTVVEKTAFGVINSSLSEALDEAGISPVMTDKLASIYAWTINFFALQKGDRFKVVYTERYINDSIPAGIDEVKAAYFEHKGTPLLAFSFVENKDLGLDYYDEEANNLRRAFLKSPIRFNYRISSRYNLRRRITYYGNQVRPHRGTDFAAPVGTPIIATADGTVTESTRRGGNGKYVKIKHNSTYSTQYLHMKAQNVKVGDFVRQGDVIGWVGMTGNTGGPHVCYRFWKNGEQVDPFKQDLPASKPLADSLRPQYFEYIKPLKEQLDCIIF